MEIKDVFTRIKKTPKEYTTVRFAVAKRSFAFVVSLYFLAYLFTVGGFYFGPVTLTHLSAATYHLYSLLVIATMWFAYSLVEYIVYIYAPEKKWILIAMGVFVSLVGASMLAVHLGLLSF